MTLDGLIAEQGFWDGVYAMIHTPEGYVRCVAIKRGDEVEFTDFGRALLANPTGDAVSSEEPKKRGRKPKVEEIPDPDDLDDLEI